MKKSIVTIIMFLLLLGLSVNAYAAEGNITAILEATTNKTIALQGEEVEVTLTLKEIENTTTGIKNVMTKISYDTNIFETITQEDIEAIDQENMMVLYNDNDDVHELTIGVSTDEGIKTDTAIAKIKFKVKENALATTTNIIFTENSISETSQESIEIEDATVSLEIGTPEIPSAILSKIEITKQPTKTAYKIGEKFDPAGMEVTAVYEDGTTNVVTNYTYTPMEELKKEDTKVIITYKEGDTIKTAEQAITVNEEGLPDTGTETYIIIILAILVITIISFVKAKKYSNI